MRVNGETISDTQQVSAWDQVNKDTHDGFKFADLRLALITHGVSADASYRGADRMLQRGCKRGFVSFGGGKWVFV